MSLTRPLSRVGYRGGDATPMKVAAERFSHAIRATAPFELTLGVAIAVVVLTLGLLSANPEVTGLYHDDGIYLASAQALAEGRSYTLINLPTAPAATKYPPLYPVLLALIWSAIGDFPGSLLGLKAINCVLLAALVIVMIPMLRGLPFGSRGDRTLALLLLATAPATLSFADLVLSEPLYMVLSVSLLAMLAGWDAPPKARVLVVAGTIAALAALTRTVGVTLCAAVLIGVAAQVRWRALWLALPMALLFGAWLAWIAVMRIPPNDLLNYYVLYESSGWTVLLRDPALGLRIILTNVPLFAGEVSRVFGLGPIWLSVPALAAMMVGAWTARRSRLGQVMLLYATAYILVILGHPYPMARYLAPLAPIVFALTALGLWRLRDRFGPPVLVVAMLLLVSHGVWTERYMRLSRVAVHGEFGRPMPFEWPGFLETADWVRLHTSPDAILASGQDPFYFMYTGRRAIRPWVHDTHIHRVGRPDEPVDGAAVLASLRALGVTHLVEDPLLLGADENGRRAITAILASAPDHWREVFCSRDGRHRVHELRDEGASAE